MAEDNLRLEVEETSELHPLLRQPGQSSVTNEELFFDLVYVFAVTQLSEKFLHDLDHRGGWGAGETLILWLALWLGWQYTAWTTTWFNPERMLMRICVLVLMSLALIIASSIENAFGDKGGVFAGCYVGLQVGRTAFTLFQLGLKHPMSKNHIRILCWCLITTGLWIGGACVGHNLRFGLWIGAVTLEMVAGAAGFWLPFLGRSDTKSEWAVDGAHLNERNSLFVIISLGESLISSGHALTEAEEWDSFVMATFFATLLGTIAMWWLYFGTSAKAAHHRITNSNNPGLIGAIFHHTHAILILGIIVTAVGDDCVAEGPDEEAKIAQMLVISLGPVIYLAGSVGYKFAVFGTVAYSHLAGIVFLGAVMPIGYFVNMLSQSWLTTFVLFIVCFWELWLPQSTKSCGDDLRESSSD